MWRLLHFCSVSSLTQIIKLETPVLKEKRSRSSVSFLMVLCSVFSAAGSGWASVTSKWLFWWNKRQYFFKKPCTPVMPLVSQGLLCSSGPKNISYMRRVSAPYFSQRSSGVTTLYQRLDILSTSLLTNTLPSALQTNSCWAYCGCHALSASSWMLSSSLSRSIKMRTSLKPSLSAGNMSREYIFWSGPI